MDEIEALKSRFDGIKNINLTESQKKAVCSACGPVLVLAVPGSGKTTVLVMHLGYLIYVKGVAPESILTMTYTVAAANDMRRRFASFFGQRDADRIQFRTINGVCAKIIGSFEHQTGRSAFSLVTDEKAISDIQFDILKKYLTDYPSESDVHELGRRITYAKNMMLTKDEIKAQDEKNYPFSKMFNDYCECLKRGRLMDYDDQMVYALSILKSYPSVLGRINSRYTYVLVDEAQDTSKIQHKIIDIISEKNGNLFMVGDEDQSIYGFRAAYPEALIDFEKNHAGAQVLTLEKNFRSDGCIVEAADRFIRRNRFRHEKTMIASFKSETPIRRAEFETRRQQYAYLCEVARNCTETTAVLYRDNESAVAIADRLEREGINYNLRRGDMAFFTNRVVLDVREIIGFALHPDDTAAFMRLYFKLGTYLSRELAVRACEYARDDGISVFTAIRRLEGVPRSTRENCAFIESALSALAKAKGSETMRLIIYSLNYREYVQRMNLGNSKLDILTSVADGCENSTAFIERLDFLRDALIRHEDTKGCPFILSTVHSSKGLEYNNVFLIDVIDGIFPETVPAPSLLRRSTDKLKPEEYDAVREYEEQRRLFYVAVTRAKRNLTVFTYRVSPSVFTDEIFAGRTPSKVSPEKSVFVSAPASCDVNTAVKDFLSTLIPGSKLSHRTFGMLTVTRVQGTVITVIDSSGTRRQLDGPSLIKNRLIDTDSR